MLSSRSFDQTNGQYLEPFSLLSPKLKAGLFLLVALFISACSSVPKSKQQEFEVGGTAVDISDSAANVADQTVLESDDLLTRMAKGFSLPELNSRHVEEFENWSADHPTYLNNLFERARPFLYHIVEQVEARGMPMEIALLPAVESAYKPTAVSRSRAVGMWQFLAASGQDYGLEQDWWYDGRRDILASTSAALNYLAVLHKRFDNDWFLALAAYNGGQGNLARSIRANENKDLETDYLALDLRLETRRYVPKLLALRNIVQNPEKFGVSLPSIPNAPAITNVPLRQQIDLHALASSLESNGGPSKSELLNLNSGFLRWATPPSDSVAFTSQIKDRSHPLSLVVPSTDPMLIQQVQQAMASAPEISFRSHRIRGGDTLGKISRQYGVSVAAIRQANGLRSNTIRLGRTLVIPLRADATANLATYTPASIQSSANSNNSDIHRVRQGETLWSIARRYSVTVSQLLSWNRLSVNTPLQLNQSIKLRP